MTQARRGGVVALVVSAPRAHRHAWRGLLGALERLTVAGDLDVVVVTRDAGAARDLRSGSRLPVHRTRTTEELTALLDSLDVGVVVYPEQHRRNFQALAYRRARHVFVGDPGADVVPRSGPSHLLRAYDHVVVADEAAARVAGSVPGVRHVHVVPDARGIQPAGLGTVLHAVAAERDTLAEATNLPDRRTAGRGAPAGGVRERVRAALEGPGRRLRARLRRASSGATVPSAEVVSPTPVILYFPDDPARSYQARTWLGVLERVVAAGGPAAAVVTRHAASARELASATTLPVLHVPAATGLAPLYARAEARAVLYVSNSVRNFDSLGVSGVVHLHLGHGESDKSSSVSHQMTAYDTVVVAGRAAARRLRRGLLDGDAIPTAVVGRPQLDLPRPAAPLPRTSRRTVVYAPTWSGESSDNDFSSLDTAGAAVADACLADSRLRLVYRPHPRTVARGQADAAHAALLSRVEAAALRDPSAGHVSSLEGDVLALVEAADVLVADVSSVAIDFLLLAPDRPIILLDPRGDRAGLDARTPLARAAEVVDTTQPGLTRVLAAALERVLTNDVLGPERERVRDDYAGVRVGRSVEALGALLARLAQGDRP